MNVVLICSSNKLASLIENCMADFSIRGLNLVSYCSFVPEVEDFNFKVESIIVYGFQEKKAIEIFKKYISMGTGFIYFAKKDKVEKENFFELGIDVVEFPTNKEIIEKAIMSSICVSRRIENIKGVNSELENKLIEEKIVSRAKLVIMTYLNLSEDQAHKYIEKQAMDLRMTKKQVATRLLEMYES